jgi:pilus assembly protein FimV
LESVGCRFCCEALPTAYPNPTQGIGCAGDAGYLMVVNKRLAVILAALLPAAAGALGLGEADVSSRLNQPLNAHIQILAAGADDLKDLTVSLAPREAFERQGLDRPAFLNALSFRVSRDAAGHVQVDVRSTQPVTEPFLTFLVAVDWPRGHLVREYTLLIDPPVFEAQPSTPTPLMAPASGVSAAPAGAIDRAPAAPATTAAPASGPLEHRVQAGETLSSVVRSQGYSAAADVNRALVATFRANPSAFDGNINRLHRGALLRLPPKSEWSQLGVDEATAEVHRQVGAWKGGHREARLRLVVPKNPPTAARAAAPSPAASASGASSAEVAEVRRLLELKNAELARLQAELAQRKAPTPPPAQPVPAPAAASPTAAAPLPTAPSAAATAPKTDAPARKLTSTPVPPVSEPGVLDVLMDNALTLIGGTLGVLVLVLVGLKWRARQRREATEVEPESVTGGDWGAARSLDGDPLQTHPRLSATPRSEFEARQRIEVSEHEDESDEFQPPPFNALSTQAIPHSATPGSPPLDSRLGAESSITLHHTDPLAEADFHIAYGLYTQAADILKLAMELDPSRSDLTLKLLEVYFVAGDTASFLSTARLLDRSTLDAASWDRVAVMGRQIAPSDPLFAGRLQSDVPMDLDLDGGLALGGLDLEIAGGDTLVPDVPSEPADASDFHLQLERDLLDLSATLDPGAGLSANEATQPPTVHGAAPAAETTSEIDLEDLGIPDDVLKGLPVDETGRTDTVLAPRPDEHTRRMPSLRDEDSLTVRMPSIADLPAAAEGEDSAEDLLAEASRLLEQHWSAPAPSADGAPMATDTAAPVPAAEEEEIVLSQDNDDSIHPTAAVPIVPPTALADQDHRASIAGLRMDELNLGDEPLEFDLDDLARALQDDTLAQPGLDRSRFASDLVATGLHVQPPAVHADADDYLPEDDVSRSRIHDLDLPDLDPVTLSEVGTKLDLARAYLDMGDPDGARAILDEVMSEGSPSQKSEAQRILETLPG